MQGKLHHMRPFADVSSGKCRSGFGIEADDARRLDLGCCCGKLLRGCRYKDAIQREADKRLQQRDLILGWGDFFSYGA
ncbi:MAG TPA: hypothetical protein VFK88_01680 [Gallionella sp.]|nr:hypothetical protein [Gallionella sp.]